MKCKHEHTDGVITPRYLKQWCVDCKEILKHMSKDEFGEERVYTETDLQYRLMMQARDIVDLLRKDGHPKQGNWQRLLIAIEAAYGGKHI